LISSFIVPTFPAEIMQESCALSGTATGTGDLGMLSAVNCDSISHHGIKIDSGQSGIAGWFSDGSGAVSFEFCSIQNPFFQNQGPFQSKLVNCHIYGDYVILGTSSLTSTFSFYDGCTGGVFDPCDSLAALPVFQACGFFGCDVVEPRNFVQVVNLEYPKPVLTWSMKNCLFRDPVGDALILHGASGFVEDCDFQRPSGTAGNDITVSKGAIGVLELRNVHSSVPGLGFGLVVDDGQAVRVDAATYGSLTPLSGAMGDMKVGNGLPRTWAGYASAPPDGRPPLLELDYTSLQLAAGPFSDAAPLPAFIVGTGSKVFS
jgi:hypothetical protein